jgi:hypothetical protein
MARSLHHIPIPDLKNIIFNIVYLQKGGSNWGIKTIQTTLWLIPLRVPRLVVRDALHELQQKNEALTFWSIISRAIFYYRTKAHVAHGL